MAIETGDQTGRPVVAGLSDEQFVRLHRKLNEVSRQAADARSYARIAASNTGNVLFAIIFVLCTMLAIAALFSGME